MDWLPPGSFWRSGQNASTPYCRPPVTSFIRAQSRAQGAPSSLSAEKRTTGDILDLYPIRMGILRRTPAKKIPRQARPGRTRHPESHRPQTERRRLQKSQGQGTAALRRGGTRSARSFDRRSRRGRHRPLRQLPGPAPAALRRGGPFGRLGAQEKGGCRRAAEALRGTGSPPDRRGLLEPPAGRARWTLRLLAGRLVEL